MSKRNRFDANQYAAQQQRGMLRMNLRDKPSNYDFGAVGRYVPQYNSPAKCSPGSAASAVYEEGYSYNEQPSPSFDRLLMTKAKTPSPQVEDIVTKANRKRAAWQRLRGSDLNFKELQQVQVQTLSHAVKQVIQDSDAEMKRENYQVLQQQYDSANLLLGQAISLVLGDKSLLQEALEKEAQLAELRSGRDNYEAPTLLTVFEEEEEEISLITPQLSEDLGFEIEGSPASLEYSKVESPSPVKIKKVSRPPSHQPDQSLKFLNDKIVAAESDLEIARKNAAAEVKVVAEEYKSDFQPLVQTLNVAQWTILNAQKSKSADALAQELKTQLPFFDLNLGEECVALREKFMKGFIAKEATFFEGQRNIPSSSIEALVRNAAQEAAIKKYLKREVKALREQAKVLKDMGGKRSWSEILKAMPHGDTACGVLFSNISKKEEAERIIDEAFDPRNVANFEAQFSEIDGALKEARGFVQEAMLPLKQNEAFKARRQNLVEAFQAAKQKFLEARVMGAKPDVKPENLNLTNITYLEDEGENGDQTLRYTNTVAKALNAIFSDSFEPESVVDGCLSSAQLAPKHEDRVQLADELAGGITKAMMAIDKSIRIVRKDAEAESEKIARESRDIEERKARLVENLNYAKSRLEEAKKIKARTDLRGISDGDEVESKVMANTFSGEFVLEEVLEEAFEEQDSYAKKQQLSLKIQTKIGKALEVIESSIEAVNAAPLHVASPVKKTVESKVIATPKKLQPTPAKPVVSSVKKAEETIIEENDAVLNLIFTPMKRAAEHMQRIKPKLAYRNRGSAIRQPNFSEFVLGSAAEIIDENRQPLDREEALVFQKQVAEIFSSADADETANPEVKMKRALQALASSQQGDPKKLRTFLRQVQPFILQFNEELAAQEKDLEEELQELTKSNETAFASLADALQEVAEDLEALQDQRDFEKIRNEAIVNVVINEADETSADVAEADRSDFHTAAMRLFSDPEVTSAMGSKNNAAKRALESLGNPQASDLENARRRSRFLRYLKPLTERLAEELDEKVAQVASHADEYDEMNNTADLGLSMDDYYPENSYSPYWEDKSPMIKRRLSYGVLPENSPVTAPFGVPPKAKTLGRSASLPKGIAASLSPEKSEIINEVVDAAIEEVAEILRKTRAELRKLKPANRRLATQSVTVGDRVSKLSQAFEDLDQDYQNEVAEIDRRASEVFANSNDVEADVINQVRKVAKVVETLARRLLEGEAKTAKIPPLLKSNSLTASRPIPTLNLKRKKVVETFESESEGEESPQRKSTTVGDVFLSGSSSSDEEDRYSDISASPRAISINPVAEAKARVNTVRANLMKLSSGSRRKIITEATDKFKKKKESEQSSSEDGGEEDTKIYNIFRKLGEEDELGKESRIEAAHYRIERAFKTEEAGGFLEKITSVTLQIEERVARKLAKKTKMPESDFRAIESDLSDFRDMPPISFMSSEERPSPSVAKREGAKADIKWIKDGLKILNSNTERNLLLKAQSVGEVGDPYNTHKFMRALNLVSALDKGLRDKLWDSHASVQGQILNEIGHEVDPVNKSILTRFLLGEKRWKELSESDKKLTETDLEKIKTSLDQLVSVVPENPVERRIFFHGHALNRDPKGNLVQQAAATTRDQEHSLGIRNSSGVQTHQLVTLKPARTR